MIRDAFQGVTLGHGIGLFEGQGLDDYADAATCKIYRDKDQKDDWKNISTEDLNHCYSSLSFLDAEGMRFHLPAFLIAELYGELGVDPIFHLTHLDDFAKSKLVLLSNTQRNAIREFLLLVRDEPDYLFNRPMIEQALENYWIKAGSD